MLGKLSPHPSITADIGIYVVSTARGSLPRKKEEEDEEDERGGGGGTILRKRRRTDEQADFS